MAHTTFLPLSIFQFGIADVTQTPTKLLAYAYMEDIGGKGGNNVASILIAGLKQLEWMKEGKCGKELMIIMNNCGGQNKNRFILHLAFWLVECGYFKKVMFMFYICSHMKNACDQMFNQLKIWYHRCQVYTMAQLLEMLNEQPHVILQTFLWWNSAEESHVLGQRCK